MMGTVDRIAYEMFMMDCGDEPCGELTTVNDQIVMEAYALLKTQQSYSKAA